MSRLNANALPFHPVYTDEHALFFTFSNGFPLSEMQILDYFNGYYAPYVERVIVHTPRAGNGPSLFGKIVFRDRRIPAKLMENHEKIQFTIEGRHLYCRRFVSQPTNPVVPANDNSSDGTHFSGEE